MSNKAEETKKENRKSKLFITSFLFMLIVPVFFGFMKQPTEMGLSIVIGLMGMGFANLEKIEEISGLGIAFKTREINRKIIELEQLEYRLNETNEYMVSALIAAFRHIGFFHITNERIKDAGRVVFEAIRLYAHNPSPKIEDGFLSMLGALSRWISDGKDSKEPLISLLKKNEKIVLSDYNKMKENDAPSVVTEKYEEIMTKANIDW